MMLIGTLHGVVRVRGRFRNCLQVQMWVRGVGFMCGLGKDSALRLHRTGGGEGHTHTHTQMNTRLRRGTYRHARTQRNVHANVAATL